MGRLFTYTATEVLGTTTISQLLSLKLVLRKHINVKAPKTVMAKANSWLRRVRAEYILETFFTRCALDRIVPVAYALAPPTCNALPPTLHLHVAKSKVVLCLPSSATVMDPSPIRIVVQQAWKPEVIIEESEEEVVAFNKDQQLPTTVIPVMKPRVNVIHLEVPKPQMHRRSRSSKKKKRSANSVRRVAKTLQFVTKWGTKRRKNIRQAQREAFVKNLNKKKSSEPVVRPSYSIDKEIEDTWILNYLPLNPTSYILYW